MTDVKVLDVETKQLLKSANSKGVGQDSILLTQVDELTRKIADGMGVSKQPAELNQTTIAESMTKSPEAYDYYLKGVEEMVRSFDDEARKSFEKAVELDPTFAAAYIYLADSRTSLGIENLKKAKAFSDKAPEKFRLFIDVNCVIVFEKNQEKAQRLLQELVEKYPQEKLFRHFLASRYLNMGEKDKAVAEFQKILELDPNFGAAVNELAWIYSGRGEDARAIALLEKFPARSLRQPNLLDTLGAFYFKVGRLDDALAKFKEALETEPSFVTPYVSMAWVHSLKENYGEALRCLDQYLAGDPSNRWPGYYLKGFLFSWLGQWNQALEELQKAKNILENLDRKDRLLSVYCLTARTNLEKGDLEQNRKDGQAWFDFLGKNWPGSKFPDNYLT
jgi:tetratricopeptide (TPR) repeat protein